MLIDVLEIMAAVSLMVAYASLGRWWKLNPARWRLAVPALSWMVNATLFVGLVIAADVTGVRIIINGWGLVLIIHAAVTFVLYFVVMGVRRVNTANRASSDRSNR